MKENRYIRRRDEGKLAVGHMLMEFGTRGIARMTANAGADFVLIDTEHAPFSSAQVADIIAWFAATDVAPFVRIPQIEYHFIARTMDAGALGIMVPNVKSGEQARKIVSASKYAPLGDRGVALGGGLTGYDRVEKPREFLDYSNKNTTIICQIESLEGLDAIEEIATTDGVDVLWVGHFDLTQSMGIPGEFDDPRFGDALDRVVETCKRHGLGAGIQPGNLEQAQAWIERGFDVISFGSDQKVYQDGLQQGIDGVRALTT